MPKVTVIIPNYNHAPYLVQRIESVLNQSFRDFNVLLLDDCSTDESMEIINRYSSFANVKILKNENNSGCVFKQWNLGVRMAEGEYIWLAESDDFADEHFLHELVPVLDAHPDVGLVKCRSLLVDQNNNRINETWHEDADRWQKDFVVPGKEECRRHLFGKNEIANASAVLFRKKIYINAGYAEENMSLSGDWFMWFKMMMISDFASVGKILNYWRRHKTCVRSATHGDGREMLELIDIKERMIKMLSATLEEKEKIHHSIVTKWVNSVFYFNKYSTMDYHFIPLKKNSEIFRKLKTNDQKLLKHILQCVTHRLLHMLGVAKR